MLPSEALGISAQVAVTLAGFTGIVVAFATGAAHEWPATDRFRLRLLLTGSIVPLVLSLIGLMLLVTDMPPQRIWALASGVGAVLQVISGFVAIRTFRNLTKGEFREAGGNRTIFYISGTIATGVTVLQFVNALILRTFWPFFLCIVISMIICVVQFTRLVTHHPGREVRLAENADTPKLYY